MSMLTVPTPSATGLRRSALVLVARVRRFLNAWIAADIACRERQAAWVASHQIDDCDRSNPRIHRGPIDDAVERAVRLRKRRRLKRT